MTMTFDHAGRLQRRFGPESIDETPPASEQSGAGSPSSEEEAEAKRIADEAEAKRIADEAKAKKKS